jgi:histidinol-phosphate aminotransferase
MSYFRENIEKMEGYTPGFQPKDAEVVKLNTNENPYPPSPKVLEAIRTISAEQLRRYPQPLGDTFRQAAAEVFGVSSDSIMCTNGGDDLLTICFRAFCDENRRAAYPSPTYSLYPVLAGLQGCSVIEIPFSEDGYLDKLAETDAALTIICNPNAPTCTFEPIDNLAELAGKLKGILLVDEAYVDFSDDNCIQLMNELDNIIILRSMSKGYSLAGIRFGFCIARPALIEGLMKVKDSYNVDTVALAAATAAIKDREYFKANVEKIKAERARLTEELKDLGFTAGDSQTNFILAKCSSVSAADIYKELVKRNIYVRYFKLPGLSDKIRITVGTKEQNDILIGALKEIVSE